MTDREQRPANAVSKFTPCPPRFLPGGGGGGGREGGGGVGGGGGLKDSRGSFIAFASAGRESLFVFFPPLVWTNR